LNPLAVFDSYLKWLPQGPDPNDPKSTGNAVKFRIYLQDQKKPGQKIIDGIASVKYYFGDDISHEPGYAMNFPVIDPDKKLICNWVGSMIGLICQREITEIILLVRSSGPGIKVESFDYGGYGKLKATLL